MEVAAALLLLPDPPRADEVVDLKLNGDFKVTKSKSKDGRAKERVYHRYPLT